MIRRPRGDSLNIILLDEIGQARIEKIKLTEIKDFLIEGEIVIYAVT